MAMPGRGHKTLVQIGREAVFGTPVAATHKFEVINWNINPVVGIIRDPSLYDSVSRRGLYEAGKLYRGTFTVRGNYIGINLLLDGVFGAATFGSNGGVTTGTGPYVHTLKEGELLNSHTFEVVKGGIPSGSNYWQLSGAVITSATFRITAGQGDDAMMQVEFGVLGTDYQVIAAAPTVITNFPALAPILYHQATTVDDGTADVAADVRVRSVELRIENNVADDRYFLSSKNVDQPIRNDFIAPTWRITQEFKTKSAFDAARAFTNGSPQFIFTAAPSLFQLRSGSAVVTDYSDPIEGYGIIEQTTTWEAYKDSVDASAVVAVLTNANATIQAAN